MPDLAPILSVKFDALRTVEMPGAKLFLFEEGGTSDRRLVPIVFREQDAPGLVRRGWRVNPRRFDRFGQAQLEIFIARDKVYNSTVLERVAGFLVLPKGAGSGMIHKCQPAGIAQLGTEPTWRFSSLGRSSQIHYIALSGITDGFTDMVAI